MSGLKIAIIVVDYQIDFISGTLALSKGTAGENPLDALPHINAILSEHKKAKVVIYTRDMHPSNHISFFENARNSDRELKPEFKAKNLKVFDTVEFVGKKTPQTLYPAHCVKGSLGSEFQPEMILVPDAIHINKAEGAMVESFSGFCDNDREVFTALGDILRHSDVNTVLIVGIAYDICVRATALDAAQLGFKTAVAFEACKALDFDGIKQTDLDFHNAGVVKLSTTQALRLLNGIYVPPEWVNV